jgi:hypothetical protein
MRGGTGADAQCSYVYLLTPDIPPFNRKYKDRKQPFFGIDDRIPLLLTLLLGIQHALSMIGGGTCDGSCN